MSAADAVPADLGAEMAFVALDQGVDRGAWPCPRLHHRRQRDADETQDRRALRRLQPVLAKGERVNAVQQVLAIDQGSIDVEDDEGQSAILPVTPSP